MTIDRLDIDAIRERDESVHPSRRDSNVVRDAFSDRRALLGEVEQLQIQLKTMTGNRDRCLKVHRDTLAKWADTEAKVGELRIIIERYLEAVTSNAPEEERNAAWDALVLTVW